MENIKYADLPEKVGRFGVALTSGSRRFLDSRSRKPSIQCKMIWIEDGVRVVLQMYLCGEEKISEYLGVRYLDKDGNPIRNERGDERRPLLYRIRFLLGHLYMWGEHFPEFPQWGCHELEQTMSILADVITQVHGEKTGARFRSFNRAFFGLFDSANERIVDESSAKAEIRKVRESAEEVFDEIRVAMIRRETAEDERESREGGAVAALERTVRATEEMKRLQRRAIRMCEGVIASRRAEEERVDPYSRLAGLENCGEACRKELQIAFKYSHEKYPVKRGARQGEHSLKGLAFAVWRANRAEFEALAKLIEDPGYKNALSLSKKRGKREMWGDGGKGI